MEAKQLTTLDQPIKYPTKGAAAVSSYLLTLEPGLYVRPAEGVPEAFWHIGIRIEDDAIVTDSGCELITRDVRWTKSRVRAVYAHQVGPDARLGGKGNSFWASVMSNDYWPAPTCGR